MELDLDPRARRLLRTLISQHIRDGEPVGSRTLARSSGLDVSPATIRNIMSDLEEIGLVAAPHASAGRIPTAQGYRVFVDSLLQMKPLQEADFSRLRANLPVGAGTQALLSNTSELLSAMSQFVGVVTVPQRGQFAFRHIDFVPLDGQRVLVILVFTDNEVQNRIISPRRAYTPAELEQTANFLNSHFAGRPLHEIRATPGARPARHPQRDGKAAVGRGRAVRTGAGRPAGRQRRHAAGRPDPPDGRAGTVRPGPAARAVRSLFPQARDPAAARTHHPRRGVRVFIGEETGLAPLDACTVVTAPYGANGRVLGVLGVIGPTRMAYDRVIPMVQATADLLGAALNPETPAP